MVLDIIILFLLVSTMVFGFRRGFMYTFSRTLGWIGAMLIAFFATPHVKTWLMENTSVYNRIFNVINTNLAAAGPESPASLDSLPQMAGDSFNALVTQAVQALATQLAGMCLTIVSFFLIFFIVKIIATLITGIFFKKKNSGFTGLLDGLLGMLAGGVKGLLLVFIFLALLFPAVNLISPISSNTVLQNLNDSIFAHTLYDSNFILVIIDSIFH